MKRNSAIAYGCFALFLLPFCATGIFMLIKGLGAAADGDWGEAGLILVFALVFGGVGFGLIGVALRGRAQLRKAEALEQRHPSQPWLWRPDWAAGRLEGSSRSRMALAWAIAAFVNLIAWAVAPAVIIEQYQGAGEPIALLVLLFPAVGALLLIWPVRATLRYRRFGVSVFRMAEVPGVIGRRLHGVIVAGSHVRPVDGFHLTLTCTNRVGSGDDSTERVIWQEQRTVRRTYQVERRASAVPVSFRLPSDVRQTSDSDPRDRIAWQLEARASVPGVDYHAIFEVPVFRTPESDTPLPPGEDDQLEEAAEDYRQPPDSRILVTRPVRGTEIYFAPARNAGAALGVTVFFGIWTAISVALPRFGAPILFPIVFGLFAVLLFLAVLSLWFGTTRVALTPSEAEVSHSTLGLGRTRTVPADDIDDIGLKIGMQVGNRPFYDIQIIKTNGKKVPAGSAVRDKREAEWLVEQMKEALEL
jgi:hypothetical protein